MEGNGPLPPRLFNLVMIAQITLVIHLPSDNMLSHKVSMICSDKACARSELILVDCQKNRWFIRQTVVLADFFFFLLISIGSS